MKKKALARSYNQIAFAILGFVLGLFFIVIGLVITPIIQGTAIDAVNAVQALSSTPLLWILCTLPLLFAFVFGWSGGCLDELDTLRYRFRKYAQTSSMDSRLLKSRAEELELKNKQAKIVLEALGRATKLQSEDLRSLEVALESLQSLHEALFRLHPLAAAHLDLEQVILDCNPAFCELFGYPRSEIVGEYLDDLICPSELSAEARGFGEAVQFGETVHAFSQRRTMDGHLLEVEIFGLPVLQAGEIRSILALYRDTSKPLTMPALGETEIGETDAVSETEDFEPLWLPDDTLVQDEASLSASDDFQDQAPAVEEIRAEQMDFAPIEPFQGDQPDIAVLDDQTEDLPILGIRGEEAGLEQIDLSVTALEEPVVEPESDVAAADPTDAPESEAES